MSRRISSREDVFISAVDLYSLLSLAFIGIALLTVRAVEAETAEIKLETLPIVPDPVFTTQIAPETTGLSVLEWNQAEGQVCSVKIIKRGVPFKKEELNQVRGDEKEGYIIDSPCWPKNFATTKPPSIKENSIWNKIKTEALLVKKTAPIPIAVYCKKGGEEELLQCARLQWLLAEAGFAVTVTVVQASEESSK